MKIAIPTFATRVSPRFDCAQSVLVVTVADGKPQERRQYATERWTPHERIERLRELGVDTVICGGIDRWSVGSLQSSGVTVYGWVTGEVEDALAALLEGQLDTEAECDMPGRCRCRRFLGESKDGAGSSQRGNGRKGRNRSGHKGRGVCRRSPGAADRPESGD